MMPLMPFFAEGWSCRRLLNDTAVIARSQAFALGP